jgi:hypothetical protein
MKTNPSARYLVRIWTFIICLIIAAVAGVEFWAGESLAARIGQTTAVQTDSPTFPNVNISDLMAAAP